MSEEGGSYYGSQVQNNLQVDSDSELNRTECNSTKGGESSLIDSEERRTHNNGDHIDKLNRTGGHSKCKLGNKTKSNKSRSGDNFRSTRCSKSIRRRGRKRGRRSIYNRVNIGVMNPNKIEFDLVSDLNFNIQPERAGVITYIKSGDTYTFCLGVDSHVHEITDFGGNVEQRDKTAIDAGWREFNEETHNIFKSCIVDRRNYRVAHNGSMIILFIQIDSNITEASNRFHCEARKADVKEIDHLIWLNMFQFYQLITKGEVTIDNHQYRGYSVLIQFLRSLHNDYPQFVDRL